jgi:hypothetical protein
LGVLIAVPVKPGRVEAALKPPLALLVDHRVMFAPSSSKWRFS